MGLIPFLNVPSLLVGPLSVLCNRLKQVMVSVLCLCVASLKNVNCHVLCKITECPFLFLIPLSFFCYSENWSCIVPLKATQPSPPLQRWLDVVVSTKGNSSRNSTWQDLPVTISLRSKSPVDRSKRQKSINESPRIRGIWEDNLIHEEITGLDKISDKKSVWDTNAVARQGENNNSQAFPTSVKPAPTFPGQVKNSFVPKNISGVEKIIKLLLGHSLQKNPSRNKSREHNNILRAILRRSGNQSNRFLQNHSISENNVTLKHNKISQSSRPSDRPNISIVSPAQLAADTDSRVLGQGTIHQTLRLLINKKNYTAKTSNFSILQSNTTTRSISQKNNTGQPLRTTQKKLDPKRTLSNKAINILEKIFIPHRKHKQQSGVSELLLHPYDHNQFSSVSTSSKKISSQNQSSEIQVGLSQVHNSRKVSTLKRNPDLLPPEIQKSIPLWLQYLLKPRESLLRRKRSIRQVDDNEATDIAILMNGESKADQAKIAAMIASDFETTAQLSDPLIATNQWQDNPWSRLPTRKNQNLKEMDHLIDVLEDERVKVTDGLPMGDGDDEDLLVEVN